MISYRLIKTNRRRDTLVEIVMMLAVSSWSVFGQVGWFIADI